MQVVYASCLSSNALQLIASNCLYRHFDMNLLCNLHKYTFKACLLLQAIACIKASYIKCQLYILHKHVPVCMTASLLFITHLVKVSFSVNSISHLQYCTRIALQAVSLQAVPSYKKWNFWVLYIKSTSFQFFGIRNA